MTSAMPHSITTFLDKQNSTDRLRILNKIVHGGPQHLKYYHLIPQLFGTSVGFGKRVTGKLKWPLFS